MKRALMLLPPSSVVPKFKTRYVPKMRFLTLGEFEALLSLLPEARRHWVRVAVYTGGRLAEVEGLVWEEHINLVTNQLMLPGTKTAKARRSFEIPPALGGYLRSFESRTGPVVEAWPNVRRDLAVACKRLGIPKVTPNDLRRTFASWLKQQGVDSMVVARLLGHTTSRMVELVYGHLNNEAFKRAVATLPAMPKRPEEPGSKWVVEKDAPERKRRRSRKAPPTDSKVLVPRGGIEPPTRGFSEMYARLLTYGKRKATGT
jgi:integrase